MRSVKRLKNEVLCHAINTNCTLVFKFEERRFGTTKNLQEKHNPSSERGILIEEKEKIRRDDFIQQGSLHILHVDGDAAFLRVSKLILELDNKFEIDTATSVDEAFCKLKTLPYDVIVCEYALPRKNGLDFLKELREQKNDVAFIIFTDSGTEGVVIRAINLRADYYIAKTECSQAGYRKLVDAIYKIVEQKKELSTKSWK